MFPKYLYFRVVKGSRPREQTTKMLIDRSQRNHKYRTAKWTTNRGRRKRLNLPVCYLESRASNTRVYCHTLASCFYKLEGRRQVFVDCELLVCEAVLSYTTIRKNVSLHFQGRSRCWRRIKCSCFRLCMSGSDKGIPAGILVPSEGFQGTCKHFRTANSHVSNA
jgi:hypothetical protein